MNLNIKSISIGTAFTGLVVSIILGIQGLITPTMIIWGLIGAGLGIAAWLVSWVWTQFYKSFFVPPSDLDRSNKTPDQIWSITRIIYIHAVGSGLMVMGIEGIVLFTLTGDDIHKAIWGMLWSVWSIIIAGSSPFMWKVVFEGILPWLTKKVPNAGVRIDRDPNTGQVTSIKDETDPSATTQFINKKDIPPEDKK